MKLGKEGYLIDLALEYPELYTIFGAVNRRFTAGEEEKGMEGVFRRKRDYSGLNLTDRR